MAKSAGEAFDSNFNMRIHEEDRDAFYAACETNGEPDGAKVIRRMMNDYVEGDISYSVQQEDK